MQMLIRLCSSVLPEGSLLVFDWGEYPGKQRIRDLKFHYLTLKAKKKGPYRNEITIYHARKESQVSFVSGNGLFMCQNRDGEEVRIFFCDDLACDRGRRKQGNLRKTGKEGKGSTKKVERGKDLGQYIAPEGWIIARGHLQKIIGDIPNPYVTGLEGFFVLESTIDDDPENILSLQKIVTVQRSSSGTSKKGAGRSGTGPNDVVIRCMGRFLTKVRGVGHNFSVKIP
ncbi:MAG: hypothetical protein IPI71_01630 [Methanolinea sp.]|nr:MAG: hypothetical protein IPI71_01630 [Methanolinea sp.]